MSRAKKPRLQREKLVEIITKAARRFARAENFDGLYDILDSLGWDSSSDRTAANWARAVVALVALADDNALVYAAHTAIWARMKGDTIEAREIANKIADRTLVDLGVPTAECGCLTRFASDSCCNKAAAATSEREIVESAARLRSEFPDKLHHLAELAKAQITIATAEAA